MRVNGLTLGLMVSLVASLVAGSAAYGVDLARVNSKVITDKDIQNSLGGFNEGQKRKLLGDDNSKKEILSSLIEQELLLQEAEKQKLDQDAAYKDAINQFRRQYLSQRLLDRYVTPKVTNTSARNYYNTNRRKYSSDQVDVMHILVNDEKTANDVKRLASASNADFQALAEKYSKDPSAKNNRGYIGPIGWDAPFVEEFKEEAFRASKGQVVGPVKTSYGYHVIKVQDKRIGQPRPFDEVELIVREHMKRDLVEDYVARLRKGSKVSTNAKALDSI